MKLFNPFKRKTDPKMEDVYTARRKATENKNAMADKIIQMVDKLKVERRCGIVENYVGPERREANA